MTLFLTSWVTHVCQHGQKAGQCGGMNVILVRGSASVFVLLLTGIPRRRETGQCSHSVQITRILSDGSMQRASWREERMKANPEHDPHTGPTFILPICAILTGISLHAFISITPPRLMGSSTKNKSLSVPHRHALRQPHPAKDGIARPPPLARPLASRRQQRHHHVADGHRNTVPAPVALDRAVANIPLHRAIRLTVGKD